MSDNSASRFEDHQELGQYIPLHYHFQMLAEPNRMAGFKAAIDLVVPAGGKVVDLGAGTGALSFFAARKAARVHAVEMLPELAEFARKHLERNGCADRVDITIGDARAYLPPEPVDVVICEMLHSALLREKQLEVIRSFKARYREAFGDTLPVLLPYATVLGVEPVQANFSFEGYEASISLFEAPGAPSPRFRSLGEARPYGILEYHRDFSTAFRIEQTLAIATAGRFNALRFITKNVLAMAPDNRGTVDWMNQHLILPLKAAEDAKAGERFRVCFDYAAGAPIRALQSSIEVTPP
ncbi:MAG: methyltransferase domain-containing protein [Rhodospirillales bacterium]|nr:methyltransferase domain-containing protein [Rhodospirillales bacterium]